jgi:hypothetical protein
MKRIINWFKRLGKAGCKDFEWQQDKAYCRNCGYHLEEHVQGASHELDRWFNRWNVPL